MKLEEFLVKSINKHGLKFDYSKIRNKTVMSRDKVKIICPIHGEFIQTAQDHYLGAHGCEKCSYDYRRKIQTGTLDQFIIKANKRHKGFYDYSESVYVNDRTNLKITCPIHGAFYQTPNNHYVSGCLVCGNISSSKVRLSSVDKFIKESKKIHNNYYKYDLVVFKGRHYKVKIICPKHGVFEQVPNSHIKGVGCSKCKRSKGELAVSVFLEKNNIKHKEQRKLRTSRNSHLYFDFYIPSIDLFIEYQGRQHYEPISVFGGLKAFKEGQKRDNYKRTWCKENNHNLLEIKYTDYKNINKILNKYIRG